MLSRRLQERQCAGGEEDDGEGARSEEQEKEGVLDGFHAKFSLSYKAVRNSHVGFPRQATSVQIDPSSRRRLSSFVFQLPLSA